ncbi:hypothetical protein BC831DRAFT_221078 [Entophlyctis helioformis]|nr:hypothetical protein BC831DRAFT_221078 [Entophlyctis helioformis]
MIGTADIDEIAYADLMQQYSTHNFGYALPTPANAALAGSVGISHLGKKQHMFTAQDLSSGMAAGTLDSAVPFAMPSMSTAGVSPRMDSLTIFDPSESLDDQQGLPAAFYPVDMHQRTHENFQQAMRMSGLDANFTSLGSASSARSTHGQVSSSASSVRSSRSASISKGSPAPSADTHSSLATLATPLGQDVDHETSWQSTQQYLVEPLGTSSIPSVPNLSGSAALLGQSDPLSMAADQRFRQQQMQNMASQRAATRRHSIAGPGYHTLQSLMQPLRNPDALQQQVHLRNLKSPAAALQMATGSTGLHMQRLPISLESADTHASDLAGAGKASSGNAGFDAMHSAPYLELDRDPTFDHALASTLPQTSLSQQQHQQQQHSYSQMSTASSNNSTGMFAFASLSSASDSATLGSSNSSIAPPSLPLPQTPLFAEQSLAYSQMLSQGTNGMSDYSLAQNIFCSNGQSSRLADPFTAHLQPISNGCYDVGGNDLQDGHGMSRAPALYEYDSTPVYGAIDQTMRPMSMSLPTSSFLSDLFSSHQQPVLTQSQLQINPAELVGDMHQHPNMALQRAGSTSVFSSSLQAALSPAVTPTSTSSIMSPDASSAASLAVAAGLQLGSGRPSSVSILSTSAGTAGSPMMSDSVASMSRQAPPSAAALANRRGSRSARRRPNAPATLDTSSRASSSSQQQRDSHSEASQSTDQGSQPQAHAHNAPQQPIGPRSIMTGGTRRRQQVKIACIHCKRACKRCDEQRPCSRCVRTNQADSCIDAPRRDRRRPHSGTSGTRESNEGDAATADTTTDPSRPSTENHLTDEDSTAGDSDSEMPNSAVSTTFPHHPVFHGSQSSQRRTSIFGAVEHVSQDHASSSSVMGGMVGTIAVPIPASAGSSSRGRRGTLGDSGDQQPISGNFKFT